MLSILCSLTLLVYFPLLIHGFSQSFDFAQYNQLAIALPSTNAVVGGKAVDLCAGEKVIPPVCPFGLEPCNENFYEKERENCRDIVNKTSNGNCTSPPPDKTINSTAWNWNYGMYRFNDRGNRSDGVCII